MQPNFPDPRDMLSWWKEKAESSERALTDERLRRVRDVFVSFIIGVVISWILWWMLPKSCFSLTSHYFRL